MSAGLSGLLIIELEASLFSATSRFCCIATWNSSANTELVAAWWIILAITSSSETDLSHLTP